MQQQLKKKILFILQLPPPVHGASLMNNYVVNTELLQNNFNTKVINLQFARNTQEIEKFSFQKIGRGFYFAWAILKAIGSYHPDLIYFTFAPRGFAFYRDLFYGILIRLSGRKAIYHLHGKGLGRSAKQNFINRILTRWVFKKANLICLSQRLTTDVAGVYPGQPYVVPNGIPADPVVKKEITATPELIPNILYLSNYIRDKGILVLIDALKILLDQGYRFNARLVGSPGDLSVEFLEKCLTQLGLEANVKVVGPRYGDEKIWEFQHADLFAFPTFYANEAFPLVNLEAMQFGLPIISTNEGGIPDMLQNEQTGFIIDPQNAPMLAEKIAVLLQDEALRKRMGAQAYEHFSSHFTLKHFENNLNKTFQSILGISPPPAMETPKQGIGAN